jgi:hypothetical protein
MCDSEALWPSKYSPLHSLNPLDMQPLLRSITNVGNFIERPLESLEGTSMLVQESQEKIADSHSDPDVLGQIVEMRLMSVAICHSKLRNCDCRCANTHS